MSILGKQAPLWSLILVVLATTSAVTAAFIAIPQLSDSTQVLRDFSVTSTPSPITIEQGSTAVSTVTLTSQYGYDLSTALAASPTQTATEWLTATIDPTVVTPTPGGKVDSTLTVTSLPGTPAGTYQLTIFASGGTKSHTSILLVLVTPAPDFTISPSPSSLTVLQNTSNTTTLTLTSQNGFTGEVSLEAIVPFAFLGVAGDHSPVKLGAGGSNTTRLAVYASGLTPPGPYTVTVTATSGTLQHTVNVLVTVEASSGCGPPMCGTEALNLENYVFSSGTNVTLYLRNVGSGNVTLLSYYVQDSSGNQYALTSWNGPNILTNSVAATIILIGSSCPGCVRTGTAFTFTSGNTYTVTIVTSRNNQFRFTIVR